MVHENLCLQLEVDSKTLEIERLKQQLTRCDAHTNLKYVNSKTKSNTSEKKEKKIVRIDSNTTIIKQKPEKETKEKKCGNSDAVTKIYERNKTPDVPIIITELSPAFAASSRSSSQNTIKSAKESMALMQVSSNASAIFGSEIGSEPIRTESAPEIVQSSVFSDSCKSCESSIHVTIQNEK